MPERINAQFKLNQLLNQQGQQDNKLDPKSFEQEIEALKAKVSSAKDKLDTNKKSNRVQSDFTEFDKTGFKFLDI